MDNFTGSESGATQENTQGKISWDKTTEEQFKRMIEKIPVFLRGIAEKKVSQKAERIVREEKRREIFEKDMVDAFFAETPPAFREAMKSGMQELGIDYTKYGYAK